jgi:hypothetical protein
MPDGEATSMEIRRSWELHAAQSWKRGSVTVTLHALTHRDSNARMRRHVRVPQRRRARCQGSPADVPERKTSIIAVHKCGAQVQLERVRICKPTTSSSCPTGKLHLPRPLNTAKARMVGGAKSGVTVQTHCGQAIWVLHRILPGVSQEVEV